MKSIVAFIIAALISFLICCNSEDSPTGSMNLPSSLLSVNHSDCIELDKDGFDNAYLKSFSVFENSLYLQFHFIANCCAEFTDSVHVEQSIIRIFMNNISSINCRCVCPHESEYLIIYPYSGTTRIELWMAASSVPEYDLLLETTIDIPQ